MSAHTSVNLKSWSSLIASFFWMAIGAFFVSVALEVFLIPNNIVDGGIIGLSMIASELLGREWLPIFLILFNTPFVFLAYRFLGKGFVVQMLMSLVLLAGFIVLMEESPTYIGDPVEVIFSGGIILGFGLGLIIRKGGALDGTEIVGIIINRFKGYTVGQVVLVCNFFIFALAGWVFNDWRTAVQSLMTYVVVIKIMDTVIVGLEETKGVSIISTKGKEIAQSIMHDLGLGLTIKYGRGGFSGEEQEILYVIIERLQLAELKNIVHSQDPQAFIAVENIHEVLNGSYATHPPKPKKKQGKHIEKMMRSIWGQNHPQ